MTTTLRTAWRACASSALISVQMLSACAGDAAKDAADSPGAMMAPAVAGAQPQVAAAAGAAAPAPMTSMTTTQPPTKAPSEPAPAAMASSADAGEAMQMPEGMQEKPLPWVSLISMDWKLEPGQERYFCQRVTLTEDVYFSAIRAINPPGTHHTALTAEPDMASEPDGMTECGSALSPQGIFGSGVGTNPVFYPDGVGLKLRAGQQMLLNLHVFNTSEKPLSGTSGTEIIKTSPDKIANVAESLLAGPVVLDLPPHEITTASGTCTMTNDTTLFAVQPHMHQLGIHMKGVAHSSVKGDVVLHDADYSFDNQVVYSVEPLEMRAGDAVDVECTFNNTTDATVNLGESSKAEMCFMVLHRYPAAENPSVTCFF